MIRHRGPYRLGLGVAFLFFLCWGTNVAVAQAPPLIPSVTIGTGDIGQPQQVSVLLQILFLLTILSLAPAILVMMTSFTKQSMI